MSTFVTILAVVGLIVVAYLIVKLQSGSPGSSTNIRKVKIGMRGENVRRLLGEPDSKSSGGSIVAGSEVVGGMGSAEAFLRREHWFYDHRGSDAVTCVTISPHGVVEDIETRKP